MTVSFRPGDSGFDLHAPTIPQPRRGHGLAYVGVAILIALAACIAVTLFRHLDRPAVSEMRGSFDAAWSPPFGAGERVLVARTVGEAR